MFNLGTIIGMKVVAIKAYQSDRRRKTGLEPRYILFSDKVTLIELVEQDYYAYHDCSTTARHIEIRKNKDEWKRIYNNKDGRYSDANYDIWKFV